MIHRLESGLRVVVQPTDATTTALHLWFDAGAIDERPRQSGAAHFVEHLLFKGTAQRGVGEHAAAIESLGGDLNAWTSWDETVLHATVADAPDQALEVLIDMARAATFDPAETERERLVVLEEMRSYEGDPDSVAAERLQARLFGRHPYGRPVIGHRNSVQRISRSELHRFWRTHYHPGRAVLVAVGPVDPSKVLAQAAQLTKGWETGTERSTIPAATPRRGGHEVLRGAFESIVVAMGWPAPAIGHADEAALDVLVFGLGEGAAARLPVLLDLEHAVATNVWSDTSHWLGGGMISISFGSHHAERAVGLALAELRRVARHGLEPAEVERSKQGILADLWFAAESSHGIASELAWSTARLGDPQALDAYKRAVREVTPAQVREVAGRWLEPAAAQIVVLDRSLKPEVLRREVAAARTPSVPPTSLAGTCGDLEVVDVAGIRVAVRRSDRPVAAVRVLAPGGQLHENARVAGLAEAWARTAARAAGPLDPRSLAIEADALALRLDATAGRTAQRIGASFPAHQLIPAMSLVGHVLTDPQFDPSDWAQIRDAMLDDLRTIPDDADTVAYEAMWRALWPRHPFRLATLGTEASLRHILPSRLRRFHTGTMAAGALVVGVAGGVDPDDVYRGVERWAESISREPLPLPTPPVVPPSTVAVLRRAGAHQAVVQLGVRGVPHTHPDRLPLEIASGLLDSQAGRLFLALREAQGLAYSVWASSSTNEVGGVFAAGLATDPERVAEAEAGLRTELLRLASEGPTEADLARTVRMVRGGVAAGQQRVATQATTIARALLTGQDPSPGRLDEALQAITPAKIREAMSALGLENALRVTVLPP